MRKTDFCHSKCDLAGQSKASEPRRNRDRRGLLKVVSLVLFGCVCCTLAAQDQRIVLVGTGSSVPLPLYHKWAEVFNQNNPTAQFQYRATGTTEGIAEAIRGSNDFGAGEAPLTPEERRQGNLTELPVVLIGIVPIFNLPGIQQLRLSGEVLADVYLGQIKKWNDPAIAKLNPGVALPNIPIRVVFRPGGKGSNYVFSDFLSKTSVKFHTQIGRSASPKWPAGEPAERSADMADKVKNNPGTLGYVELQYADENHIAKASVLNPAGKFVIATAASITAACTAAEAPSWDKFAPSLTNAPGADSYPIASFTWLYVHPYPKDPKRTAALVGLLNWGYTTGQGLALQMGYSELPQALRTKVKAKVNAMH